MENGVGRDLDHVAAGKSQDGVLVPEAGGRNGGFQSSFSPGDCYRRASRIRQRYRDRADSAGVTAECKRDRMPAGGQLYEIAFVTPVPLANHVAASLPTGTVQLGVHPFNWVPEAAVKTNAPLVRSRGVELASRTT